MDGDGSASGALAEALLARLADVRGLNDCREGGPARAAPPHAALDIGVELDWGHKSGAGREIRFSLVIRDEGETPARLRRVTAAADAAVAGLAEVAGWALVSLVPLRGGFAGEGPRRWRANRDYRARLLAR
jgi:hypothetical protein